MRQEHANKPVRITGEQRREQIIDAAIDLFSEAGFAGTTTRRLAEAAGISEAALYLHFETKEALYEAIIRRKAHEHGDFAERLREAVQEGPQRAFREVADSMIQIHTGDKAFLRLLLFSGLEQHALFRMFFEAQMRECGETLRSYIEGLQRQGIFRPCDPRLAVRAFMGMLVHHLLTQEVFRLRELGVFSRDEVVATFVDLFLHGLYRHDAVLPGREATCA
jgi:AcrR family transcriptional regulator